MEIHITKPAKEVFESKEHEGFIKAGEQDGKQYLLFCKFLSEQQDKNMRYFVFEGAGPGDIITEAQEDESHNEILHRIKGEEQVIPVLKRCLFCELPENTCLFYGMRGDHYALYMKVGDPKKKKIEKEDHEEEYEERLPVIRMNEEGYWPYEEVPMMGQCYLVANGGTVLANKK